MRLFRHSIVLAVFLFVVFAGLKADAGDPPSGRRFLVCNTQAVADKKDVKPYIEGFGSYLASKLGWSDGEYGVRFEGKRENGVGVIESWKPGFVSLSLGLFLEQRKAHSLKPLVLAKINGSTQSRFRILVKKGTADSVAALEGKTLTGSLVDDPEFITKVLFESKWKADEHFVLKRARRPLRAIRKVARGRLDAVLVDDMQFNSLKGLPLFEKLDVVWESKPIPNLAMAYRPEAVSSGDARAFADALVAMCKDPEGKKLCKTFALEGFEHVDSDSLSYVIQLYGTK